MRVMVFGKANEDSEKGAPPTAEAFAAMDRFTEELVKAGVLVAGAGLKNSAQAKRIVCEGPGRTVIDGPFAETRELVAGFSIWEVKDMDEAVAWAKRSPNLGPGRSEWRSGRSRRPPIGRVHDARGALGAPGRRAREARRRLIPSSGAGLSPRGPGGKMRCDRRRNAQGRHRSDLSH